MKRELELALQRDFPSFFRDLYGSPSATCMAYGITCEDGWEPIIRRMCGALEAIAPDEFRFEQIKEKFGTLRVYTSFRVPEGAPRPEEVLAIIEAAELESWETCESCGVRDDAVRCKGTSYIRTLCPECRSKA